MVIKMLRKLKTIAKVIKGETMYKGLTGMVWEIERFYIRLEKKTEIRYWMLFPGIRNDNYAWFHPNELRTVL